MLRQPPTETYFQETTFFAQPPATTSPYIGTLGHFRGLGGFDYEQIPNNCVLHIITGGDGSFESKGITYRAKKGTAYMFFKGQYVKYYENPKQPWRYTWLSLGGDTEGVFSSLGITRENPCLDLSSNEKFWQVLAEIENELINNQKKHFASATGFWRIVNTLDNQENQQQDINYARWAKSQIDGWTLGVPSVEALADKLGVDRTTLFRHFKQEFRTSLKSYIEKQRLEKASTLLKLSKASIKQVALSCGYTDQHYFSRAFKQYFRITPREWRNHK